MGKVVTEQELETILSGRKDKKVGYSSGTFDILHHGHVDYLKKAKEKCDIFVVGVNSDSSVKAYKSPTRPISSHPDRAAVLAGLEAVDYVFIFDDLNNNRIIEKFKPDFYIKGGDYSVSKLSSSSIVDSYGGEVILIPMLEGYSTTRIMNKILETQEISEAINAD